MVLIITTLEIVTKLEGILMIIIHKVKQLLNLSQEVKYAQGGRSRSCYPSESN